MRRYLLQGVLLLLISSDLLVLQVKGKFLASRTWHEQFLPKPDTKDRKSKLGVIYPTHKTCIAPRERPEKVSVHHRHEDDIGRSENTWSSLLSMTANQAGKEIHIWDGYKEDDPNPNKPGATTQFMALLFFITMFLLLFTLFICYVPVMGCILFTICNVIWGLIFHPEIRRVCRRTLIVKEKVYMRTKTLLPWDREKVKGKRHFRLPFVLREYTEEEIPAELFVSDEDSEKDVPSDGFEDLLIKIRGREKSDMTGTTKTLLSMMASTEQELSGVESTSRTEIKATPTPTPTPTPTVVKRSK